MIKRTKIFILLFGIGISTSLFISCHKNQASWDAQILAPIINASLSINDIVTSKYITSNPDSTVSLVYTDSLYNLSMDTLVAIPDTVIRYDTVWPLPTYTVAAGGLLFYNTATAKYNVGGVELTKGILQSGWLVYILKNHAKQPVDYTYIVNTIMMNGYPLKIPRTKVNADSTIKDSIFLGGADIDFTGPMRNGYNEITSTFQVNVDSTGSTDTLKTSDTVFDAEITFRKIIPYYAQGYFGTTTKSFGPTNVAFPVFNKIIAGNLSLKDVNVNLTLSNGFGVDASLILSRFTSNHAGDTINLKDNGVVGSTINVNRAKETGNPSAPVSPSVMNFAINPTTSPNILAWLDNLPTSVGYELKITTDPLGNVSGFHDFAYYGYGISSAINVTIPLSLIANNLTLADTLAVNFAGSGSPAKQVKSGKLTIYASNGFPFSAGLQMYILNQNNVVSDSLFIPPQAIASGTVNSVSGKVTSPVNSVLTISLDAARTQELFNTKNIILYARFNMGSAPSTYRQIYSYYQLGLKMVANFDYLVN